MPQQASTQPRAQSATQGGELTGNQLNALRDLRTELEGQQHDLTRQRAELVAQSSFASADQKAALQQRIAALDARSAAIDRQLSSLNDRIASAVERGVGQEQGAGADVVVPVNVPRVNVPQINIPPFAFQQHNSAASLAAPLAIEAGFFLFFFTMIWQFGWRRVRQQLERALGDQTARVAQLQQAIDVIGVEVERISEGQRYVAKVLTDGETPKIPTKQR